VGEPGTSQEIVSRGQTRDHADLGVMQKVVREQHQVPLSKGAPQKLHALSREGTGHSWEMNVRDLCTTSRIPRQGDSRL
jgi:hypothetical protein